MFPADVLYFQLKMAQILRIRRTTFGSEDGPRPDNVTIKAHLTIYYES